MTIINVAECDYVYIHPRCGGVAFYIKTRPTAGSVITLSDFVSLNGTAMHGVESVRCGNCHMTTNPNTVNVFARLSLLQEAEKTCPRCQLLHCECDEYD